jgi:hypothetical protein
MPDDPAWKRALREPNAIAWIALFLLVIAIGAGSIYFSGSEPARLPAHHAAK